MLVGRLGVVPPEGCRRGVPLARRDPHRRDLLLRGQLARPAYIYIYIYIYIDIDIMYVCMYAYYIYTHIHTYYTHAYVYA